MIHDADIYLVPPMLEPLLYLPVLLLMSCQLALQFPVHHLSSLYIALVLVGALVCLVSPPPEW